MALPKVMSGSRAIFRINGNLVAFAASVGYRIDITHNAVAVLGRYSVARHEPVAYDIALTASQFRFTSTGGHGNSPDNLAIHLFPRVQDIATADELNIEVVDRITGDTLLHVSRAKMTNHSSTLGARDLMTESFTFVGVIADNSDSGPQAEAAGANVAAAAP